MRAGHSVENFLPNYAGCDRPVGAWHGNGRKSQWWSPVLLALRDGQSSRLVAVCKCMSGQWIVVEPIIGLNDALGFSDVFYKVRNRLANIPH